MSFTNDEWAAGLPFEEYLARVRSHADIWRRHWEHAELDDVSRARLADLPGPRRVLVLSEDGCGDAARSVPLIARACRAAPGVEIRVVTPADHAGLMDRHLTKGAKAIPVVMAADGEGRDLGWWGPRPAPLQTLLRRRLVELGPPSPENRGAFYAPLMAWYRKDGGRTILDEFLLLLERGAR